MVPGAGAFESPNPSDTDEIVAKSRTATRPRKCRGCRGADAFPGWSDASPEVRADLLDKVGTLIMRAQGRAGPAAVARRGQDPARGHRRSRCAPARIFKFFAGEALRRHGEPRFDAPRRRDPDLSRSRRRLWPDHALEFPHRHSGLEERPGPGFRQHRGDEVRLPTPATAHALMAIIHEAGAPGVFNLVLGGGSMGDALSEHPDVDGVSFTGADHGCGRRQAALSQRRVQLEMGGKNPLVVLDDCELDRAIQSAVDGAFFATGQRCTASSRVIVRRISRQVRRSPRRPRQGAEGRRCAGCRHPDGPARASAARQHSRLCRRRHRARWPPRGGRRTADTCRARRLRAAALIADTARTCASTGRGLRPRRPTVRVKDYDEALAVANGGEFRPLGRHRDHLAQVRPPLLRNVSAGMVMINLPTAGVDYHVPFGGTRGSAPGRASRALPPSISTPRSRLATPGPRVQKPL